MNQAAEQVALAAAGLVIVALTIGGFWLSYAHLAQVAGQHGLGASPARRWAWPATLDAFIIAGELLMLRAGLRQVTDGWAIALTATGSVGSIALNVAGVSGTNTARPVPLLDYVVAAVPPAAALLAFGVLMRQIHHLVERPTTERQRRVPPQPAPATTTPCIPSAQVAERKAIPSAQPPEPRPAVAEGRSRGGRPASASLEELLEIGRIAEAESGKLTRAIVEQAIRAKGHTIGGARLTQVMDQLRPVSEDGSAEEGG